MSVQRQLVVTRVLRAHADQLRHVTAAGTAEQAQRVRVALPVGRLHLQPANAVVRVLHRRRVGRFAAQTQIDGHGQQAAARHGFGHRHIGRAILERPGAAVQVEQHRKRPVTDRLTDSGKQHARRHLPEVLFPNLNLVVRVWIVVGCHRACSLSSLLFRLKLSAHRPPDFTDGISHAVGADCVVPSRDLYLTSRRRTEFALYRGSSVRPKDRIVNPIIAKSASIRAAR